MRRILVALGLILLIYILGSYIVDELKSYVENASLLITGVSVRETKTMIKDHASGHILAGADLSDADIDIVTAYIDADTKKDIIATIASDSTCGSGGCITFIFLRTENDTFIPIPFEYAVKELSVEHSVTDGMHDLRINNDPQNIMVWDGNRYVLNSI